MRSEQNNILINKTSSPKDTAPKRLNIFTYIYNPNKQSLSPTGIQMEDNNSPNLQTTQTHQHTSLKVANQPKRVNEKRRNKLLHSKSITDLPIRPKQQKMNVFGFKSGSQINDYQKNNFTPIETTIQPTLENLQKFQRNDYFGNKLFTKPIENLCIINLNINGLDLGKGEHSLLQMCSNLQDKGTDLLYLTETNTNRHRQYLVQKFSSTYGSKNKSLCTSESSLPWNSNYKARDTTTIALGTISSAIIAKREDTHELGRWTTVTMLGKHNKITSVFNMYRLRYTSIEKSGPITVIKQQ